MMSPEDLQILDEWSFQQRIRSRGKAIRQLIELGLQTAKKRRKEKA